MDATVISFDDWEEILKTDVQPDRRRAYREAIIKDVTAKSRHPLFQGDDDFLQ